MQGSIDVLNDDLLLKIFSFVDAKEIPTVSLVCKSWAALLKCTGDLYRNLLIDHSKHCTDISPERKPFVWASLWIGLQDRMEKWLQQRAQFAVFLQLIGPPAGPQSGWPTPGILVGPTLKPFPEWPIRGHHFNRVQRLRLQGDRHCQTRCVVYGSWAQSFQSLKFLQITAVGVPETFLSCLINLEEFEYTYSPRGALQGGVPTFTVSTSRAEFKLRKLSLDANYTKGGNLACQANQLRSLILRNYTHFSKLKIEQTPKPTVPTLHTLVISRCSLLLMDRWGTMLDDLRVLDLSHNKLTRLPTYMARLAKLERLDLSSNDLPRLPPCLPHLTELTFLDLSFNKALQLDEEDQVMTCTSLRSRRTNQRQQGLHRLVLDNLIQLQVLRANQSEDHPWSAESKVELQLLRDATSPTSIYGSLYIEEVRPRNLTIEAELK